MNFFTNKNIVQKIVIAIVIVILTTFCIPNASQADAGGKLMKPIVNFVVAVFDGVQHLLEKAMLGETSSSFMKDSTDKSEYESVSTGITVTEDEKIDEGFFGLNAAEVPVIKYTPEEIFSNRVPALDVNFINPSVTTSSTGDNSIVQDKNVALTLRPIIASWYVAMRYIAIVGLLSVLVYIGIRMLLTSVAADRAKYKQMLFDWIVAICLVFILHYIMSFTMAMSESITAMLSPNVNGTLTVNATNVDKVGSVTFSTNLMGYVRFMIQSTDLSTKIAFLALYIMLVIFSIRFTWIYLKRVVNMAFLTLIAPLVALTYPIDKVGDGKAQAFGMWIREYVFNALIQPLDLLLYTVLLGSSVQLATDNPLYAIVALGFIIAAEKLVKQMFGFNKASGGTVGSLAAAAGVTSLAGKALNAFGKQGPAGAPPKGKIRTKDLPERQGKDNGANSPFGAFNGKGSDEVIGAGIASAESEGRNTNTRNNTETPPPPPSEDGNNQKDKLSDLEQQRAELYNQGYTDDSDEIKELNDKIQSGDWEDDNVPSPDEGPSSDVDVPSPDDYLNNVGYDNPFVRSGATEDTDFFSTVGNDWNNWLQRRGDDITGVKDKFAYYKSGEGKRKIRDGINKRAIAAWKSAPTVAYSAARGTLKTASRVAAAGAMGGLGLAIGATTGDGEKAISMAMGAAGVGYTGGGNIFEAGADKVGMKQKSVSEAYNAAKYGSKQAARNARADKEYFKSEKFDDFYEQYYKGKKDMDGNQYTKKKLQEITQSYRTAGITSEKDIRKALKLEEQYRKANSSLSAEDARLEVQNIVQGYNDMDPQDRRAFTNQEAKENVINNLSGLVKGRTQQDSRRIAEQIFQGYVDFRNA